MQGLKTFFDQGQDCLKGRFGFGAGRFILGVGATDQGVKKFIIYRLQVGMDFLYPAFFARAFFQKIAARFMQVLGTSDDVSLCKRFFCALPFLQ